MKLREAGSDKDLFSVCNFSIPHKNDLKKICSQLLNYLKDINLDDIKYK